MQSIRATRVCIGLAIGIAGLGCVASATAESRPLPLPEPAVAASGSEAAVAWTADGVVQIARVKPDGTFGGSEGVGRTFDGRPPLLAIAPGGDEVLLWQSSGGLRSAFRTAGQTTWTFETVASGVNEYQAPHLALGADGRAIAVWTSLGSNALLVSTRASGGWSSPAVLASGVFEAAMASDDSGDVAVVYSVVGPRAGAARVWSTVLASGATTWTAPALISGSDPVLGALRIDGGGARTFAATWADSPPVTSQSSHPLVRAARLRIPAAWSAPGDVIPQTPDPSMVPVDAALDANWPIAVDGVGDVLAVYRFGTAVMGMGLDVTHLAASGDAWAPPALLDMPDRKYGADSLPAIAFGDDGSATLAFARGGATDFGVHVITNSEPLGAWTGPSLKIGAITFPDWSSGPVMALGSRLGAIALQSTRGDMIAFARVAPGAGWTRPQVLRSTGATTSYLLSAHVKKGAVRVVVNCGIPPCAGDVELQAALRTGRRPLGRIAFNLRASGTVSRTVSLPAWTRPRLRHGRHLLTHFVFDVQEGDGTREQVQRTIRLHA